MHLPKNPQKQQQISNISSNQPNHTNLPINNLQNQNSIQLQSSDLRQNNLKIPNYPQQQFDTFSPSNLAVEIDYSKGVNQYLHQMSNSIQSPQNNPHKNNNSSDLDDNNEQIQAIINQVLNKRKKTSRLLNNNYQQFNDKDFYHELQNLKKIQKVNARLTKQNYQLTQKINCIKNKIREFHFGKFIKYNGKCKSNHNNNQSERSANGMKHVIGNQCMIIGQKLKQVQVLKQRLSKAQKNHTKMQLQLSKLQQSRKASQNSLKQQKLQKLSKNINNGQTSSRLTKTKKQVPIVNNERKRKSTDLVKKDIFSPIIQFQQYSLNNSPTISLYENNNNLHKTSQFGLSPNKNKKIKKQQIILKQYHNKQIQTQIYFIDLLNQQQQFDQQIVKLENIISINNQIIRKYQGMLLEHVM